MSQNKMKEKWKRNGQMSTEFSIKSNQTKNGHFLTSITFIIHFQFTTFSCSNIWGLETHPAWGCRIQMHFPLIRRCKNKSGTQEESLTITLRNPFLPSRFFFNHSKAIQRYFTQELSPRWPFALKIKTMLKSALVPVPLGRLLTW